MPFEWDDEKNRRNIAKHGIDFQAVRPVFASSEALVLRDERREYGEDRLIILCPLKGKVVHVTYTMRGGFVRIISARNANQRERQRMTTIVKGETRVITTPDGVVLIEQPDGTWKPAPPDRTNWARLDAMTDEEITAAALDDPDAQPLDDEFWRTAKVLQAPIASPKKHTGIRIDTEVLDWFKQQGRGWQTRMNAVLRAYYERHKDA